jgi:deoxyribose-phosphate aldolase
MSIYRRQLAGMIDHTLLRANATSGEVEKLCREAIQFGFKAVCINPVRVAEAAALLKGQSLIVCSVVGFPFGTHSPETKAFETAEVVRLGAREVDMVLRVGAVKDGRDDLAGRDIEAVVKAAQGCPVKVILETFYLTDEEKIRACRLAVEAGAAFVKTSTGYAGGGARGEDVRLMREAVGPAVGVKAAGGIRTLADALRMIEAGATRLGLSSSVAIVEEIKEE